MVCKKYSLDGLSYLKCKGKYKIQGLQKQSASFSKLKKIFLGYSLIICILLENDYGAGRLDYRRVSAAAALTNATDNLGIFLKIGHGMVHFQSIYLTYYEKYCNIYYLSFAFFAYLCMKIIRLFSDSYFSTRRCSLAA